MDSTTASSTFAPDSSSSGAKRKRSPSAERPTSSAPPPKAAKTHNNHLQINYLVRQFSDTLPLLSADDTLPAILQLISDYSGVIERHESLAGNLGARPLGPILIKRFERLFDGPPRVLKTHGKEGTNVTWLDVVEFARHKPEQFNLEKMRDGLRVCQIYTKQSRVEISEEDFVLISSGMPQKLIPPQPIAEDEEKELGTLEIMERNIGHVIQLADQVSARARQLNHRLKNRRNAIILRREAEASSEATKPKLNTNLPAQDQASTSNGDPRGSHSPTSGFVAVNSRSKDGTVPSPTDLSKLPNLPLVNGKTYLGASASPATRAELLNYFVSARDRTSDAPSVNDYALPAPSRSHHSKSKGSKPQNDIDYASILLNSASPVPIPNTPSNLVHYTKPSPADRYDDSGPYKAEMLSRMDSMQRGDRVLPPCDRCRRLHMDCLKNLTACLGCTKKHAKCSWKDVTDQELIENPYNPRGRDDLAAAQNGGYSPSAALEDSTHGVPDEELLGEDLSDDGKDSSPPPQQSVEATLSARLQPPAPMGSKHSNGIDALDANRSPHALLPTTETSSHSAGQENHILHDLEAQLQNASGDDAPVSSTTHHSVWSMGDDESKGDVAILSGDHDHERMNEDKMTEEDSNFISDSEDAKFAGGYSIAAEARLGQ